MNFAGRTGPSRRVAHVDLRGAPASGEQPRPSTALITDEEAAAANLAIPDDKFTIFGDGAKMMIGQRCLWVNQWQGPQAQQQGKPREGILSWTSRFESRESRGGVTLIFYLCDQRDWLFLEAADKMGSQPTSEAGGRSGDANAARLARLLAETGWFASAHAHSPRLVREFAPTAVALVLGRLDWLSAAAYKVLGGNAVWEMVAQLAQMRRSGQMGNGLPISSVDEATGGCRLTDFDPTLAPLFRAALFVPHNAKSQDAFYEYGDADPATEATHVALSRSRCVDATRAWAAAPTPRSLPAVVYEVARREVDMNPTGAGDGGAFASGRTRGDDTFVCAATLEVVTCLTKSGRSVDELLLVLDGCSDKMDNRCRLTMQLLPGGDDDSADVEVRAAVYEKLNNCFATTTAEESEESPTALWESPEEWRMHLPRSVTADPGAASREFEEQYKVHPACNEELDAAVNGGDAAAVTAILRRMLAERGASAPPFADGRAAAAFFEGEHNGLLTEGGGGNYLGLAAILGQAAMIEAFVDIGGYDASILAACTRTDVAAGVFTSIAHSACLNGNVPALRALVERGARVDVPDADNCSLIYNATFNSHVGIIAELLTNPRSAAATRGTFGWRHATEHGTALFKACGSGKLEIVKLLLEHGDRFSSAPLTEEEPLLQVVQIDPIMRMSFKTVADLTVAFLYQLWPSERYDKVRSAVQAIEELVADAHKGSVCPLVDCLRPAAQAAFGTAQRAPADSACACNRCGKARESGFKKCGGCKAVYYCTQACQKADWKTHKHRCNKKV